MKPLAVFLLVVSLVVPASLIAEPISENPNPIAGDVLPGEGEGVTVSSQSRQTIAAPRPFTLAATSYGVSSLGVHFQFATNLNRYMNLRSNVNVLSFGGQSFSSEGFNIFQTEVHMASTGTSVDIYPFPNHGFRISPGVLFHNPYVASGDFMPSDGPSFKLNGTTYYSSATTPAWGVATVNRHAIPAFTMTTGWGNMIPHGGGRFSFPVELGVAFIGSPAVSVPVSFGQICDAQGQNCRDVATDPDFQSDLQAQAAKFKNNLDLLKTYPIVSFGVAYSFILRPHARY
jgi:hypothetical protein